MGWILVIVFIGLTLFGGAAIAYVTGAAAVLSFLAAGEARHLAILPQRVLSQLDVFTFLAMPLFILAGEMMSRGGITRALIDMSMLIVGRFRGGLGHVNVATAILMSAMSGSAVADAAATTSTLVPEMRKRGYPAEYATALTAASSVLGPLIPPSIAMIFYGALMNVSVAALFTAGILPGFFVAAGLFAYNAWAARRYNLPGGRDTEMPPVRPTLIKALPAMLVPVVMLGGIVLGAVTPTEAAALAVVISGVTGLIYSLTQPGVDTVQALREFGGHVSAALERAALLTGAIFVMLFAAAIFGYLVAIQSLPQQIASVIEAVGISGVGYLLLITAFFLIMGTVMDNMMAMVLLVPLLVPAAIAGGADPVHVGVIICLNLTIGLISPPVGGVLMVVSAMSGVSYLRVSRAVLPLFALLVALLVVLVLVPEITLYLPRRAGFIE